MKRTQWIAKCISVLLILALLLGLIAIAGSLSRETPRPLPNSMADIIPEAEQPIPEQTTGQDDQSGQEETTKPPETEPPATEPPATEPPATEPPATEPPATEPPATEPPATEPPEKEPDDKPKPDDNPGGNGDTEDDPGGATVPADGPQDDSELRIVTDLQNGEITYQELENDELYFYAYLINGNDLTLRVKIRNSSTAHNGQYLTGDGKNYHATLCRNETNFFTIYIKDGNSTVQEVTYAVRYVAQKADRDNPTVGNNPPTIETNLKDVSQLSNRNFTLTVQATAHTGKALYSSNIEVRLDGKLIVQPTGGPLYEYQMYFEDPEVGDVVNHTVTVRAWDDEGNSAFVSYNFDYLFVDTGDVIGTAYIILDATTVGLGVLEEPYTYKIRQNVPASYAVIEMLTEYGYEFDYGGTPDIGFYLRRISRGGLTDYAEIPGNLWQKVLQDNLALTNQSYSDSLGEFDYTQGSGWMYSIGGNVYAGKGLSNYFLSNGDTVYIRFTLAYGKDIGGYTSIGGSFGVLPSYCGKWINNTYIDMHQWSEQTVIKEPTCTEAGEMGCVCSVCGDKESFQIPALGHSYRVVAAQQPADGSDGYILSRCDRCQEEVKEIIPWKKEETQSTKNTEIESFADG